MNGSQRPASKLVNGFQVVLPDTKVLTQRYASEDCDEGEVCMLQGYELPHNLVATTSMSEAILGAQYAVHALPVQQTRGFLAGIKVPGAPVSTSCTQCCIASGFLQSCVL